MHVLLAPMEGVVDPYMRELLTRLGGYDYCVTEFVRVTRQRVPQKSLTRICPELKTGGKTVSGTPVIVQLLGGDVETMAATAATAARLGAPGIDINFGCPSKGVNRREGGAILLKEPKRLQAIVSAVRQAVPSGIPVSAKLRLGYDDTALALDNAQAVTEAGASFITVHARTRADGYKTPARWEWLARIREGVNIPLIANGDIRSVEDYWRCREISGCDDVMIGRGAIFRPDLARQIKASQRSEQTTALDWPGITHLLLAMGERMAVDVESRHVGTRIKQWVAMLKQEYEEAVTCFEQIRRLRCYSEIEPVLRQT
jgi:tRNA-dihydrouridine synthase C